MRSTEMGNRSCARISVTTTGNSDRLLELIRAKYPDIYIEVSSEAFASKVENK